MNLHVTLQYFCGSGLTHNIKRRGTKEYNKDDYLYFSKKIIRLQKLEILSSITNFICCYGNVGYYDNFVAVFWLSTYNV